MASEYYTKAIHREALFISVEHFNQPSLFKSYANAPYNYDRSIREVKEIIHKFNWRRSFSKYILATIQYLHGNSPDLEEGKRSLKFLADQKQNLLVQRSARFTLNNKIIGAVR